MSNRDPYSDCGFVQDRRVWIRASLSGAYACSSKLCRFRNLPIRNCARIVLGLSSHWGA